MSKAIMALDKVKAKLEAVERQKSEPIAILGMACRFPGGADTPEAFFRMLREGADCVTEVPADRWRLDGPTDDLDPARRAVRWGAFLKDVDRFDPSFFGISPREAERLDPQQRLLLEIVWEALERGGQAPTALVGSKTGVFVGVMNTDYMTLSVSAPRDQWDVYTATGTADCFSAGRIAFTFGFQGPTMVVDTACSSSLVAMHLACLSLRSGESDLCVAGGVNLMLSPVATELTAKTRALAPDGRCKTFDARGDGYVRGEGCGVVVLKRLSDAQRDGDPILATIRGSAVNQDGRSTGLTTPNVLSQQAMLQQALASARAAPEEIGYVEAHGTGTSLGDPIELEALRAVLGGPRPEGSILVLGAVKTNIGHLESAAGIAGLIKAVMALNEEEIPKNLHFQALNPRISLDGTPFVIPTENMPWKRGAAPRLAGVSSFGLSGTNAHVIVEEAPLASPEDTPATETGAHAHLLPISAKSPEALRALVESFAELLAEADGPRLADVVYTASVRRAHHDHRIAVAGQSREEMAQALRVFLRNGVAGGLAQGRAAGAARPKVVFVFPGQGSQWVGMGRQLLDMEPVFRSALESCDEVIRTHGGFSVLEQLAAAEPRSRLGEIRVVQPVLFAVELALSALWRSWGVEPDAVIGHSMGEVAAARVAGILSLEDAAKVICRRSRLLQQVAGKGAMALCELAMPEAQRALSGYEDRVSVAASNGPQSTVISGDPAALEEVLGSLEARGVFCRRVKVDVASHSPQMDPLREELLAMLRNVRPRAARMAMRSTVTGEVLKGPECDAGYWARNLREPVLFSSAAQRLMEERHALFVEMSPHPILVPSIEENLREKDVKGVVLGSLRRSADERRAVLEAVGAAYALGCPVDWKRIAPKDGRCVRLPRYPWQRQRYWIEGVEVAGPAPAPRDALEDCVYEVRWRQADRAAPPEASRDAAPGAWLIYKDRGGEGAALAALLTSRGQPVVSVVHGKRFARIEPDLYEIAPASADDHHALLDDAFGEGRRCRGVVHLASLDATSWDEATAPALEAAQRIGFLSALFATQAIVRRGLRDKPRLWLVTRGAAALEGGPVTGVAQAPLWGLGRTIALEHPDLACSLVDLDPARRPDGADGLLRELEAPDAERQVALRGGARHVARLVRSSFDAAPARPFRLEEGATYLLTGGLGGLGLATAAWMVDQGARHLALVGRRPPTEEALRAIGAMRGNGAKVLVLSADVAKREDVDRVLSEIASEMPPLRGVVHAAGVVREQTLLTQLGEDAFWPVMAPKMLGAFHLHAATKGMPLQFFVSYSSASAALGLVGQAAYAAANAVLDSISHARCDAGLPGLSVQWGPFLEAGLAAQGGAGERMGRGGLASLTPAQGCSALGRLLARPRAEAAVMSLAIQRWFDVFPDLASSPFWSELAARDEVARAVEPAAGNVRRSLQAAAPPARVAILTRYVLDQLGRVMHLDPSQIDADQPFHAYGFDSLMGLELRNRLQTGLGVKLSMADVLTHAQPDAMTKLLAQLLDLAGEPQGPAAPAEVARPGSWIVIPRPVRDARMRLFCFPYAGGAASMYASWADDLPPQIEVCAVQLPGRHERLHEPLPGSVEEIVAALVPALVPYLDRPFATFGHCLGAIVMFEVLRELAEKHGLRAEHVFASGAPAPRRYLVPSLASRSSAEFVELLRFIGFGRDDVLADDDAGRHLLPAVRSDFEAAARYAYAPGAALDAPITAFAGQEDPFAPPGSIDAWRGHTSSSFSKIVFPGEHYFIVPERAPLLGIIGEELSFRLASLASRRRADSPEGAPAPGWIGSPAPRTAPRVRLFCHPGLGRGSSIYAGWPPLLGDDVEVCAIDLPGRGPRVHELPLGRVDDVVERLLPAIRAREGVPFAFFGLDLGAIVMFELARRLRRDGAPSPGHLFVGAAAAPPLHAFAPVHQFPRERLLGRLRYMGIAPEHDGAGPADPALRWECAAAASYVFQDEAPLDVPLTALLGERDTFVPAGGVRAWRHQTTASFAFHLCPGGHDLIRDGAPAVLDVIRVALEDPPFR
jgi:acyl transferase domain-containing protein/surfactin synthase thioesterase subunit